MSKDSANQQNKKTFDTEHPYAIFSGWLVLPAIYTLFTLLGAFIMLIFVNPFILEGFDFYIYLLDVIFIPILLIIYYFWFKRKSALPRLMIFFFFLNAVKEIIYYAGNVGISIFDIGMSLVWIIYFIRSKRVKETFTS